MKSCITEDYKSILTNAIDANMAKEVLIGIITSMSICEEVKPSAAAVEHAKRKIPEPWGLEPIYIDENGKKHHYSSPSTLVKELGLPMSGIQCDADGNKCKATSAIEILRIAGYTVSGNGEPRKKSEGGKKLIVIHPDSVKTVTEEK
jgi:hypothetical protein